MTKPIVSDCVDVCLNKDLHRRLVHSFEYRRSKGELQEFRDVDDFVNHIVEYWIQKRLTGNAA